MHGYYFSLFLTLWLFVTHSTLSLAAELATHSFPPSTPTSIPCTAGAMAGAVRVREHRLAPHSQCVTMCSPCVCFMLVKTWRALTWMAVLLASTCLMYLMTMIISAHSFQPPSLELTGQSVKWYYNYYTPSMQFKLIYALVCLLMCLCVHFSV